MDHDQALPLRCVEKLLDSAQAALDQQDLPQAASLAAQAHGQAQDARLPALAARAQIILFELHFQQGDHVAAVRHAVFAEGCARQADNALLRALALVASALVAKEVGDHDRVLLVLDEAWPVAQAQGAPALQFRCEHLMGAVYQALGQASVGLRWCARAQATARAAGLLEQDAMAAGQAAELWLCSAEQSESRGEPGEARAAWQQGLQTNRQAYRLARLAGATQLEIAALCRNAALLARLREDAAARQAFGESQQAIESLPDAHWLVNLERQAVLAMEHARLLRAMGQAAEARTAAERGVALGELSQARNSLPQLYLLASELAEATGDLAAALGRHRQFQKLDSSLQQERAQRCAQVLSARWQAERELVEARATHAQAERQAQARRDLAEPPLVLDQADQLDELTGLGNAQHLTSLLAAAHAEALALAEPLCVVVLQVNQLDQLRRQHGGALADAVLCALAGLLVALCRPEDLVARLGQAATAASGEPEGAGRGSDEGGFALVLGSLSLRRADAVGDRVRDAVRRHAWTRLAPGLSVTVSLGICDLATHADPMAGLAQADLQRRGDLGQGSGLGPGLHTLVDRAA